MSASMPYPPQPGQPYQAPPPQAVAPPPREVRTAITLVWVQLAVNVLGGTLLLVLPGFRDQVLAPAQDAPGVPPGFEAVLLTIVVIGGLVGLLFSVAVAVVVAVFLRRGHRWVRVLLLVLASLAVFSMVTVVLRAVIHTVAGPTLLASTAPIPVTLVAGVVSAALYAAIVVLLFRPASRRWLDERTAQRRWAAQQRRAAAAGRAA